MVSSIHPKSNEIGFLDSALASKLKVIKSQKSRTKLGTILHDKIPLFFFIQPLLYVLEQKSGNQIRWFFWRIKDNKISF